VLDSVINELSVEDWQPVDDSMQPVLPPDVAAAIAAAWDRAGKAGPHVSDYWAMLGYLDALAKGDEKLSDRRVWLSLMSEAQSLVNEEGRSMAAAVVALTSVAAWHGGERPTDDRTVVLLERGHVGWGWAELVVPAIDVLTRAGAYFSACNLADDSIRVVEHTARQPQSNETVTLLERLQAALADIEKAYWTDVKELAWDLQRSIKNRHVEDSSRIAAAFWAQGDPGRAHAIAEGSYVPPLPILETLIDGALRGLTREDPFVCWTWASIWWPGTGLRCQDHPRLWRRSLTYRDYSIEYDWSQLAYPAFNVSPAQLFARILIHFFSGRVDDDEMETLSMVVADAEVQPLSWIRLAALYTLVGSHLNETDAQSNWVVIAAKAAGLSEHTYASGVAAPYDKFPDVPLFYLQGPAEEVLGAIERHRRGGLAIWLWFTSPTPPPTDPAAQDIFEEEARIINEIRALRLIRQRYRLPERIRFRHYHYAGQDSSDNWNERQRVMARLGELYPKLYELFERLHNTSPAYYQAFMAGSIADFAAALRHPGS
jgi:hypothetical protein